MLSFLLSIPIILIAILTAIHYNLDLPWYVWLINGVLYYFAAHGMVNIVRK
jgi:hypothetical protein